MRPGDIVAVGDDTIVLRDAQLNIARGIGRALLEAGSAARDHEQSGAGQ